MKKFKYQRFLNLFIDLKFAICILIFIAIGSSFGSFIEQDEPLLFYQENYPTEKPIYGFINWKVITDLEIDHVYRAWWFLSLLIILGICLISCTITRQFPLFINSKEYIFKKDKKSFSKLPFFVKIQNLFYIKEIIWIRKH